MGTQAVSAAARGKQRARGVVWRTLRRRVTCIFLLRTFGRGHELASLRMASYASSIFDALSFGAGLASLYRGEKLHKSTLEHDKELHVRGIASSTEQHFQELCAELLTAAKEADRDVWEQRNGQFNNLMLSSTLMFGVAVASIVEGNFNQTVDGHATAWFACFVACALSFLFVSLVCCMLVSRRMSIYMIMRSSRFVSRPARSKGPPRCATSGCPGGLGCTASALAVHAFKRRASAAQVTVAAHCAVFSACLSRRSLPLTLQAGSATSSRPPTRSIRTLQTPQTVSTREQTSGLQAPRVPWPRSTCARSCSGMVKLP